jgi:hypothetical protein
MRVRILKLPPADGEAVEAVANNPLQRRVSVARHPQGSEETVAAGPSAPAPQPVCPPKDVRRPETVFGVAGPAVRPKATGGVVLMP